MNRLVAYGAVAAVAAVALHLFAKTKAKPDVPNAITAGVTTVDAIGDWLPTKFKGWTWTPDPSPTVPYDLDASLRYTRPKTGIDYFPFPNQPFNVVSGILPLLDAFTYASAVGKTPFGPAIDTPVDGPLQQIIWQLAKQTPAQGAA